MISSVDGAAHLHQLMQITQNQQTRHCYAADEYVDESGIFENHRGSRV
jgi:hypothetical protein